MRSISKSCAKPASSGASARASNAQHDLLRGTPGTVRRYARRHPRPQEGDIVTSRHRSFDAFMGTDLHEKLKKRGIEKVIFAGISSQTCVEGTGRHALEAGYHLTFLKVAVAEFTDEAHRAAIEISYPTFGHEVLTVDEFLQLVPKTGKAA